MQDGGIRHHRALGRSIGDFRLSDPKAPGVLWRAEALLVEACRTGEICHIGDSVPSEASEANRVRGSFLRFLALGGDEFVPVHEKGIQITGAFIEGQVDLESCAGIRSLSLTKCRFDQVLFLQDCSMHYLMLAGSHLPGIHGDRAIIPRGVYLADGFVADGLVTFGYAEIGFLYCIGGHFNNSRGDVAPFSLFVSAARINGDAFLNNEFESHGCVSLSGATISGSLFCSKGSFNNKTDDGNGAALDLSHASIRGTLRCDEGFRAAGCVQFNGATIGGNLDFDSGKFDNHTDDGTGFAIMAERLQVQGNAFLRDGFHANGVVNIGHSEMGGSFDCSGGRFDNILENGYGQALNSCALRVKGSVFLNDGFHANGSVMLDNSEIEGNLDCSDGVFINDGDTAIECISAKVSGNIFLQGSFRAQGRVSLANAKIDGSVSCTGGKFENRTEDGSGESINLVRTVIAGHLAINDGFQSAGLIRMNGARIGGDLECDGARIDNKTADGSGVALDVEAAQIGGSVFLRNGFAASGMVDLNSTRIGGSLQCVDAAFDNAVAHPAEPRYAHWALNLGGITIADTLFFDATPASDSAADAAAMIRGSLNLSGARVKTLSDDARAWPGSGSGGLITTASGERL